MYMIRSLSLSLSLSLSSPPSPCTNTHNVRSLGMGLCLSVYNAEIIIDGLSSEISTQHTHNDNIIDKHVTRSLHRMLPLACGRMLPLACGRMLL